MVVGPFIEITTEGLRALVVSQRGEIEQLRAGAEQRARLADHLECTANEVQLVDMITVRQLRSALREAVSGLRGEWQDVEHISPPRETTYPPHKPRPLIVHEVDPRRASTPEGL